MQLSTLTLFLTSLSLSLVASAPTPDVEIIVITDGHKPSISRTSPNVKSKNQNPLTADCPNQPPKCSVWKEGSECGSNLWCCEERPAYPGDEGFNGNFCVELRIFVPECNSGVWHCNKEQ